MCGLPYQTEMMYIYVGHAQAHPVQLYSIIPYSENPSWRQTTPASSFPQKSSHTVPHVPFMQTSTRPYVEFVDSVLTRRMVWFSQKAMQIRHVIQYIPKIQVSTTYDDTLCLHLWSVYNMFQQRLALDILEGFLQTLHNRCWWKILAHFLCQKLNWKFDIVKILCFVIKCKNQLSASRQPWACISAASNYIAIIYRTEKEYSPGLTIS